MLKHYLLLLPMALFAGLAQADEALKNKLETMLPGMQIESMSAVGDSGFYEAIVQGQVVYFSADGKYVFQGDVIELSSRENITQVKRAGIKKQVLAELDQETMIVFAPEKTEHVLTVFTDIDCGYCRKLHDQMAEYNELGIEIRYMAFPRSGPGTASFQKAVNVWCAEDRQQAMTDSKAGSNVASATCEDPIQQHYDAAAQLGVSGTPALFMESGELLPGYIPPKRLKQILEQSS